MKIRVLFYVTPFKWRYLVQWKKIKKYIVNWLISLRTFSKYSHVEIWTPDEDGGFFECKCVKQGLVKSYACGCGASCTVEMPQYEYEHLGTCYTSTMRDKDDGTVKRDASRVLKHPERWDYIEIELADEVYETLLCWMEFEVGKNSGYSTWDILKFLSPVHFPDNKRNICSEFVNNALARIGVFKKFGIVSPAKVFKKLTKLGYKVKELK